MELIQYLFIAYVAVLAIMSLVSFILFGKDKKVAEKGTNGIGRIKEKTLLGTVAFGGAIGGFFGRLKFHHKTNKKYFSFTIYVGLLLQVAVGIALAVLAFII